MASLDHTATVPVDRTPDKDDAAVVPKIASVEQFKCFVGEIKLLGGA